MSDNSTGSSGSSTNSWTLLSPEEAATDTAGPVDDGTESIDDAPSLSEEVAGSSLEVRPSESEAPQETILSEEGHQICQETTPEFFEGGAASGLVTIVDDPEICAPVIHDTITSSPPDNDLLGAVPFSLATEAGLFLSEEASLEKTYTEAFADELSPKEITVPYNPIAEVPPQSECIAESSAFTEPASEISIGAEIKAEISLPQEHSAEICLTSEPKAEVSAEISPSPLTPEPPLSDVTPDISFVSDVSRTSAIPVVDIQAEVSSSPETPSSGLSTNISFIPVTTFPCPETIASPDLEELEPTTVREEHELPDKSEAVEREEEYFGPDVEVEHLGGGSGLRLRHVQHAEEQRQSSDEEDHEEEEFKLQERKEEKSGFSLNHLIIGCLVLLCLGSLFFSGTMFDQAVDDYDGSELSDQELLEKLAQENKHISILEAQIQSQKEELNKALQMAAEKGITDKENARMKEELSALPGLKSELEALKARVAELTQLAAEDPSESSPSPTQSSPGAPKDEQGPAKPDRYLNKKDELNRQKTLLEQSKERLEGMKKQGWHKKGLRESLVEMQQRLSNQVDHLGQRDEWKRKNKEHKGSKKGKNERDEKWNSKEMEKRNERKPGKDKHDHSQNHKEYLKKYSEEWEHKKDERKMERERRKQETSWQTKNVHQHSHDQHHESKDFWKHQDKKLRRNQVPSEHCHNVVDCAQAEGLIPVKLPEFQDLLQSYLSKLEELTVENKEAFHRLVTQFFHDDIFSHDRMLFRKFAEDVADILEDLADALKDDGKLEEKMEEFEREALWKFTA